MTAPAPAAPDYEYWSRMARWSHEQTAALSMGLDPRVTEAGRTAGETQIGEIYRNRLALIKNHVEAGWLPHNPEPAEFLAWAKANRVETPVALVAAVTAQCGVIRDWRHELECALARIREFESCHTNGPARLNERERVRPLLPREESSVLKLLLGMAMHKYGFNPETGNTPATRRIVEGLALVGIKITDETVLKWLRRAHEWEASEGQLDSSPR